MRKKLMILSAICLGIGLGVLGVAYFFFHFVTDGGITLTWQAEAGKPFVTYLIGIFGVDFIFAAAMSLISALFFFPKADKEDRK